MDFEKGDYLINIEKLKATFFDDLRSLSPAGKVDSEVEEMFSEQIRFIQMIQDFGQKMGE